MLSNQSHRLHTSLQSINFKSTILLYSTANTVPSELTAGFCHMRCLMFTLFYTHPPVTHSLTSVCTDTQYPTGSPHPLLMVSWRKMKAGSELASSLLLSQGSSPRDGAVYIHLSLLLTMDSVSPLPFLAFSVP